MKPHYQNSPLSRAIALATAVKSPMGKYLKELENITSTGYQNDMQIIHNRIRNADTTRFTTYLSINPNLSIHPMYRSQSNPPLEHHRIAATRLRLSSHYLRIETGRWARIPREQRFCPCREDLQTESHVVTTCPLTNFLRIEFDELKFDTIAEFFNSTNIAKMCKYCYELLQRLS